MWLTAYWQVVVNIIWFIVGCIMCGWYFSIFLEKIFE